MNNRQKAVLGQLLELFKDASERFEACSLAAKFCPDPWSNSLLEFSGVFMHHSHVLEDSISELEAIFDDGSENIPQNFKGPGE